MKNARLKTILTVSLSAAIALPALAHIERSEPLQSLRQSYFALVGMTFGPMGDKGKTRAKPAIWENPEDFAEKLAALRTEAAALSAAAKSGDKGAAVAQFKKTGGTCKACHDEYKARNYLY